ncbi:UNVERIFIED_CONTAM: hypothetical protein FKN15_023052 [Acipenser sinensis]
MEEQEPPRSPPPAEGGTLLLLLSQQQQQQRPEKPENLFPWCTWCGKEDHAGGNPHWAGVGNIAIAQGCLHVTARGCLHVTIWGCLRDIAQGCLRDTSWGCYNAVCCWKVWGRSPRKESRQLQSTRVKWSSRCRLHGQGLLSRVHCLVLPNLHHLGLQRHHHHRLGMMHDTVRECYNAVRGSVNSSSLNPRKGSHQQPSSGVARTASPGMSARHDRWMPPACYWPELPLGGQGKPPLPPQNVKLLGF